MQEKIDDLVEELKNEKYSVVLMKDNGTQFLNKESSSKVAVISEDYLDQDYVARAMKRYAEVRVFRNI